MRCYCHDHRRRNPALGASGAILQPIPLPPGIPQRLVDKLETPTSLPPRSYEEMNEPYEYNVTSIVVSERPGALPSWEQGESVRAIAPTGTYKFFPWPMEPEAKYQLGSGDAQVFGKLTQENLYQVSFTLPNKDRVTRIMRLKVALPDGFFFVDGPPSAQPVTHNEFVEVYNDTLKSHEVWWGGFGCIKWIDNIPGTCEKSNLQPGRGHKSDMRVGPIPGKRWPFLIWDNEDMLCFQWVQLGGKYTISGLNKSPNTYCAFKGSASFHRLITMLTNIYNWLWLPLMVLPISILGDEKNCS
jgi:hypothetical protein